MDNTIYCKVVNLTFKYETTFKTKIRPITGDHLPVNYYGETVDSVIFVTDLTVNSIPDCKGYDLIVYTK